MATTRVGIYRKWHGKVPVDRSGRTLPKNLWPQRRLFRWAVRWFGANGNRYSKSFGTRKEADTFAETKQSEVRSGKADPPPDVSLEDFTREHAELMKGQVSYSTLREHLRALRYLTQVVGDRPLRRISAQDAEVYLRHRSDDGASASTLNKEIAALRRIFRLAGDRRGYLPEGQNPFRKLESRKVSCKPIRYISSEEFARILAAARTLRWRVFLAMLYTTGLRLDEACHLTWGDIDFERSLVRVSAKRDGKVTVHWEPKDHELRQIPLSKKMIGLLAEWQSQAPDGVPYVFVDRRRYELVLKAVAEGRWREGRKLVNNVLRDFKAIRRRSGIAFCTIHDFRRSCITNWARRMPVHVVRVLAGHSSLETTNKYYLAVQDGDLARARRLGDEVLRAAAPGLAGARTDPLLTHSSQKVAKTATAKEGPVSQLSDGQALPEYARQDSNL
ncbi:MAG: tyrosine-type recombinase/integrase [Phycisphaerae bacterium]